MYLELIIQQDKDKKFQAKCPLFPKCKGNGDNKDEAIQKLCTSISRYISKTTSSFIKDKLLSNDYSEIVIDPSKKETESFQHRIIDLLPESKKSNKHKIFLKTIDQYSQNQENEFDPNNKLTKNITQELDESADEDNLLFGISLCLN